MSIDIKDFWTTTPQERLKVVHVVRDAEEAEDMKQKHKIRLRGKWIDPVDYPCQCMLEDPSMCQQKKHPRSTKACGCRCHTYWQG